MGVLWLIDGRARVRVLWGYIISARRVITIHERTHTGGVGMGGDARAEGRGGASVISCTDLSVSGGVGSWLAKVDALALPSKGSAINCNHSGDSIAFLSGMDSGVLIWGGKAGRS